MRVLKFLNEGTEASGMNNKFRSQMIQGFAAILGSSLVVFTVVSFLILNQPPAQAAQAPVTCHEDGSCYFRFQDGGAVDCDKDGCIVMLSKGTLCSGEKCHATRRMAFCGPEGCNVSHYALIAEERSGQTEARPSCDSVCGSGSCGKLPNIPEDVCMTEFTPVN